jgi:hypothetical protein
VADDWITLGEAEMIMGVPKGDITKLVTQDNVEVIYVQDNKNRQITLIPREYAEKKGRELGVSAKPKRGGDEPRPKPSKKPPPAQEAVVEPYEPVPANAAELVGPVAKLSEVITNRYEAIVTALKTPDANDAIQQNLKELGKAFEVTSQAITSMREIQRETTAGFEVTLGHQNRIMENLLTALQKADQNTESVKRYQQDFIDAINRLPEPLQAIQDVQLGLIELEEKRMHLEKGRVRFDQTELGRKLSLIAYALLIVFLVVGILVGLRMAVHFREFLSLLK